jgi:hypothetical protein
LSGDCRTARAESKSFDSDLFQPNPHPAQS